MTDAETADLFNELVHAIEAGDIKELKRRLGIGSPNLSLDKKVTLTSDKAPLLSLTDSSGNTLLLIAANLQKHPIIDLLVHCGADLNHKN